MLSNKIYKLLYVLLSDGAQHATHSQIKYGMNQDVDKMFFH